jgi:CheY-like chemotaxis protein
MTPPTVLIVDDEPANLAVLNQLLSPNTVSWPVNPGKKRCRMQPNFRDRT